MKNSHRLRYKDGDKVGETLIKNPNSQCQRYYKAQIWENNEIP